MNSLNILSAISSTHPHTESSLDGETPQEGAKDDSTATTEVEQKHMGSIVKEEDATALDEKTFPMDASEHTPLLSEWKPEEHGNANPGNSWRSLPSRATSAVVGAVKVVFTYVAAPFRYIITCFIDEQGRISPLLPVFTIARAITPRKRRRSAQPVAQSSSSEKPTTAPAHAADVHSSKSHPQKKQKRSPSTTSSSTAVATDSEWDERAVRADEDSPARNTRSKSTPAPESEEIAPSRRSIRIKLHNEEALNRRRKQEQEEKSKGAPKEEEAKELVAASLKSPSGANAAVKLTKFPRAPLPPRPLVPRRQPSYTKTSGAEPPKHAKTLVLDLDETLIHSHSKGGRFASGHMVEVKMSHAVGVGGVTLGPQVPILYYVHKRPHCDEFLRKVRKFPPNTDSTSLIRRMKVSKWFNLVIFTASVQEYADPVIDWLEIERKYFSQRYYRQHCTARNGAYIKDLSQVEPDLSKVIIVDNSPVSYIFHEGKRHASLRATRPLMNVRQRNSDRRLDLGSH